MALLAEIALHNTLMVCAIVVGAVVAFFVIRKIVKVVFAIVIAALVAAAALLYCVRAGYVSRETAEKINPLMNERVRKTVRDAGAWAGNQAKDAAKKAVSEVADGMFGETKKPSPRRETEK